MHNLFYTENDQRIRDFKEDLGFGFMDSVEFILPDDEYKNIDMYKYLHGYCDVFAYRLREKYGYDINLDCEDECCEYLIHAYCSTEINGKTYWIDCRGITDNYKEFIEEFASWDCYGNIDSSSGWFKDNSNVVLNRKGEYKDIHKEIDLIFDYYKDNYNVDKITINYCA